MDNRLLIENLATIAAITLLLGSIALGPLGRALARRIEGRRPESEDPALRDALAETEQRVAELETRLDFAERMLSQPAAERVAFPEQH
jgi:hypothetical protein